MVRSLRLRRWQKEALDLLAGQPGPDFLAVATPGAGKTTFALAAVLRHLSAHPGSRVVVVAPTSHLKVQWARAGAALGLHLEPSWSSATGRLPADMHGIVVTYQQVAANPGALRRHAPRCLVVLDELHHTGEERAWGSAVQSAFDEAPRRLALSGTPFRSDTHAIPFVRYEGDEARPDYEYGYTDALADRRVVRPVSFPAIDGFMEWTAPDGTRNAAGFGDALDPVRASERLRTALSLDGEWLPTVLGQANERLMELRVAQPDAAGLVIAADQDHARGIAHLLQRRHGVGAAVATSDDPTASARITRFADGTSPWLVAVRMVSEGVDIPRLRLGVFATTTTTELFFRQAVGRFVRHTGGRARDERAWLFIPDDTGSGAGPTPSPSSGATASTGTPSGGEEPVDPAALDELPEEDPGQLSLFEALSATVVGGEATASAFDDDPALDDHEPDGRRPRRRRRRRAPVPPVADGERARPPARRGRPPAGRGQGRVAGGQRPPRRRAGPLHRSPPPGGERPAQPAGVGRAHRRRHGRPAPTAGRRGRALDGEPVAPPAVADRAPVPVGDPSRLAGRAADRTEPGSTSSWRCPRQRGSPCP
jgi:superfamily II DNA or RNA helicase